MPNETKIWDVETYRRKLRNIQKNSKIESSLIVSEIEFYQNTALINSPQPISRSFSMMALKYFCYPQPVWPQNMTKEVFQSEFGIICDF